MSNVVKLPRKAAAKPVPAAEPKASGNQLKMSDAQLRALAAAQPKGKRVDYKDTEVPGLYARVSSGRYSFTGLVYDRTTGKHARVNLGGPSEGVTVGLARANLARLRLDAMDGVAVTARREEADRAAELGRATVSELLERYCKEKVWAGRGLTEVTKQNYRDQIERLIGGEAFHKPFASLSGVTILECYHERCARNEAADATGRARLMGSQSGAKTAVAALSAIARLYGLPDPGVEVKRGKLLAARKVRRGRLSLIDYPAMYQWVCREALNAESAAMRTERTAVAISMGTGMRQGTVQAMRWEWIDLKRGTIDIPDWGLKNKMDAKLPLAPSMVALLAARKKTLGVTTGLVIPQVSNPDKPARVTTWSLECAPVRMSQHDARKAFAAALTREVRASRLETKILMTHSTGEDVTEAHYIGAASSLDDMCEFARPAIKRLDEWLTQKLTAARWKDLDAKAWEGHHEWKKNHNALMMQNYARRKERREKLIPFPVTRRKQKAA